MQQCLEEDLWCRRIEAVDDWRVTWAAADIVKLTSVNGVNIYVSLCMFV